MSSELRIVALAGQTVYVHIMNSSGKRWNGTDFETYVAGNYADYDVALTEQGTSGVYLGDFPTAITTGGTYAYFGYIQAGGSPAEGDIVVGTGTVTWTGSVTSTSATELLAAYATGQTVYAHILNSSGERWNGSDFETYASANYDTYDVSLTEQGGSGVYVSGFPAGITTAGSYAYFIYLQAGGSPAEGDVIIGTGTIDWTGSETTVVAASGSMTGSDWISYVQRHGFVRTDKDDLIYECTSDAIQIMRRDVFTDEAAVDSETTDTISTLGEYQIDIESDFGLIISVILEDGTTAKELEIIDRTRFNRLYNDHAVTADRGYPEHVMFYAGKMYIGPIPDRTDYVYRLFYTRRGQTVSASSSVPFTALYRDVLLLKVYELLYEALDEMDKSDRFAAKFRESWMYAKRRELLNSKEHVFFGIYRDV